MSIKHDFSERIPQVTWARWGFLPYEIYQLRYITWSGLRKQYIRGMIRHRISIRADSIRYKWTTDRYMDAIYNDYRKRGIDGINARTFWDYWYNWQKIFGDYENTPRPPKITKYKGKESVKVRISQKQQLKAEIADLRDRQVKAIQRGDQSERNKIQRELDERYKIWYRDYPTG